MPPHVKVLVNLACWRCENDGDRLWQVATVHRMLCALAEGPHGTYKKLRSACARLGT